MPPCGQLLRMDEERPATTAPERSPLAEAADPVGTRVGRGSSIEAALILTLLIGGWLIASPLVIDYDKPEVAVIIFSVVGSAAPARSR